MPKTNMKQLVSIGVVVLLFVAAVFFFTNAPG
jgi:hypothetical protein